MSRGTKRCSTLVSKYTLWSHSNVDDPHVNVTFYGWAPGRWGRDALFCEAETQITRIYTICADFLYSIVNWLYS